VPVITREESKLISEAIFEKLASRDAGLIKEAEDAVNDFTRTKMREDGFYRRIMPPIPITNDDLTRAAAVDLLLNGKADGVLADLIGGNKWTVAGSRLKGELPPGGFAVFETTGLN
jgi:hypothetical protein